MKKAILMVAICTMFCAFSSMTALAEVNQPGTITLKDGVQPRQGWYCGKAVRFYHRIVDPYSKLELSTGAVLATNDDMTEAAFFSASDNFSTVCVFLRSNGTWIGFSSY